ncbi:9050_t:CDS:2 [Ambispora leptoticha]|uniref:9050_t:CDS:1 n=1 Tax=Ambispora leptoticha TaxID=144679 RepID=A0A9N9E655_9GLOM|nr:9050_t:CDS:2 [Ambispora leptoticha]
MNNPNNNNLKKLIGKITDCQKAKAYSHKKTCLISKANPTDNKCATGCHYGDFYYKLTIACENKPEVKQIMPVNDPLPTSKLTTTIMGASIKIQDTDLDITQLECSVCHQSFTGQDKENDNWEVFYDTSGTPTITDINDNEYNQKRKPYIQQKNKERYLKSKGINTTEKETKENNTTDNLIQPKETNQINTTIKNNTTIPKVVLKKDTTELINTTQEKLIQPNKENIQSELSEIELYNEQVYYFCSTCSPNTPLTLIRYLNSHK